MNKFKCFFTFILLIIGVFLCNIPFVYAKENIEIKSISVSEQSSTISIDELLFDNNTISSDISFNQVNDFVTFDVEIENNSNIDYIFDSIKNNINSDYLLIESENMGNTIKKNSNDTIRIKIKYNNELQNHDDIHLNNVSLGLVFKDQTVLINPLTARNIVIFIVAIVILILSFYAIKNKKSKALLLLLFLIPSFVYAAENYNVELKFDSITIVGRYLQYRVQINNGDDSVIDNEISFGEPIGDLPEISPREGYNNDGWIDQNNNVITSDTIITEDLLVTPKYNPIEYSITYDLNGGVLSKNNKTKYTIEDEFTLNNPTKEGYTFQGWSSDNGVTYQTSVTISKGTTGDLNFVAYFSANEDTKYTVIHNKMNLNGVYEEVEREELHGATDTPVTPDRKNYEGFIIPEGETKSINGDGSTTFIYNYERIKYDFSITDRTYVDSTSALDGNYYYGTTITLKANSRVGYTFRWSDNNTDLERTFELKSDLSLTPIYTPNTNTAYKVIHKTMNLDGSTYSVRDEMNYTGTTDSNITPAVNTYEGFTAPQTQIVKINGDGSTVVEYLYTRNKYTLTLENSEYIETTITPGEYYYGTSITLSAKERNKYTFVKWSNESTNRTIIFTLTNDTTIGPIYIENNSIVTFNSNGGNEIDNNELSIEPGHSVGELPEIERYGYYLDGWYTSLIGGDKVTSNYIPNDDIELFAKWKVSLESATISNEVINIRKTNTDLINITNKNTIEEDYTFTSNNESIATVDEDGEVTGVSTGTATIDIEGDISHKHKEVTVNVLTNEYGIIFNSNGGTISSNNKVVIVGNAIGELPTGEREGYYLDGWYTSLSNGNKIDEAYIPESNIELFAVWKKSIENASISNFDISLEIGDDETINISNSNEIEEEYTFTSGDESVATVDNNGKVTGVAVGDTTITIRGLKSNKTRIVNINVFAPVYTSYEVTFDSNGGVFDNNEQINTVLYYPKKISHTSNIDATGRMISNYGNYWTNSNIEGSDRGDTSKAHVVSIPGASSLKVDIYYNGENISYDWVSIWQGSHPDYKASSNYALGVSGGTKLGGSQSNTYVVNGNTLTDIGYSSFVISGDTVTFGFKSDSTGVGKGYGYYAIITAIDSNNYLEPSIENASFIGWYSNPECTGEAIDFDNISSPMTVYAKYGNTISYVSYNSNMDPSSVVLAPGENLSQLPNPVRDGYTFAGFYLDSNYENPIDSSFVPLSDMSLYPKWSYEIIYDSNGGLFDDLTTQKNVTYDDICKVSHTANIDDYGVATGIYGNNLSTTDTVTIQGATRLKIEVWYSTQSSSYDWLAIYPGNVTPTSSNYSSAKISGGRLGGGTSTIKPAADTSYHKTFYYDGDTVKFYFKSDSSSAYYGYYAIVTSDYSNISIGDPSYEGASFSGWYTDQECTDGNELSMNDHISPITRVYAKYTYTITYNSNGGNSLNPANNGIIVGNMMGELPVPIYEFHTFIGWFTDPEDGDEITNTYVPSGHMTLYAHWVAIPTYTVTLISNGGSDVESFRIEQGSAITSFPTINRSGYYFYGWYTGLTDGQNIEIGYIPNDDIILYARWKKSVGSMILESNSLNIDNIYDEVSINIINSSEIEEDYSFTSNDLNVVTVDDSGNVLPVGEGTTTITITGLSSNDVINIPVTVKYERVVVTFNANGGREVDSITIIQSVPVGDLPIAYLDHYLLDGWYTGLYDGVKIDSSYAPEEDITVYARYIPATEYTLSFDANGGEVAELSRIVTEDMAIGDLPVPVRSDYYFVGWLDESTNSYYSSTTLPTKNVTLKAQWSEIQKVARINSSFYTSLQSAVDDAQDNDEIVLLINTTENMNNNKTISINLNGNTVTGLITNSSTGVLDIYSGNITANSSKCIDNSGLLTIGKSNPKLNSNVDLINNATNVSYAIYNNNSSSLVINSGVISVSSKNNSTYGIYSGTRSNVVINDCDIFVNKTTSNISYPTYGIYGMNYSNITFNSGHIDLSTSTTTYGVYVNSYGTINFNKGSIVIKSNATASDDYNYAKTFGLYGYDNSKITMNNGLIDMYMSSTSNNVFAIYGSDNSEVILNDGLIKSDVPYYYGRGIRGAIVTINGGTIDVKSNYEPDAVGGNKIIMNDGNINVYSYYNDSDTSGTVYYPTALSSSNVTMNGGRLYVQSNSVRSYSTGIHNYPGRATMNGGEIYVSSLGKSDSYGIYSGTVTMNDGYIYSYNRSTDTQNYQAYGLYLSKDVNVGGVGVINNGHIVVDSIVEASCIGSAYSGSDITINNGLFKATSTRSSSYITSSSYDRVKINDGLFYSKGYSKSYSYGFAANSKTIPSGKSLTNITVTDNYVLYYLNGGSNTITFDPNGGDVYLASITKNVGEAYGSLPVPTKTGYYSEGWFTEPNGGTKVDATDIVNGNITLYAHWKKSVESLDVSNSNITLDLDEEETLIINNASEIDEDYTFMSKDIAIATVDKYGKISEVKEGTTTIEIIGNKSKLSKKISVTVSYSRYTITFDSNEGSSVSNKTVIHTYKIGSLSSPTRRLYKFEGWYTGLTDGIKVDSNYIPTGDMTLYARWSELPYYTITFDTGDAPAIDDLRVLQNEFIDIIPVPTYGGYVFEGWYTDTSYTNLLTTTTVIDGDKTYYAKWKPTSTSFASDSWSQIVSSIRNNNTDRYNIGDTRTVNLGDLGTHTLRLVNKSNPSECYDSSFSNTACGFVLEFTNIISSHNINSSSTNVGGWASSSMRTYLNNDIYNLLPTDLKNIIINTNVVSGHGSSDQSNIISTDKIYLLSSMEILGYNKNSYDTSLGNTRQLDYYLFNGTTISNGSAAIKYNGDRPAVYWLRSAYSVSTTSFLTIGTVGSGGCIQASTNNAVSPAFRIG